MRHIQPVSQHGHTTVDSSDPPQISIYSRKSKVTGKGESIENQIELCRQYIQTHFIETDVSRCLIYEDEGYSGGHTDRPRLKALLNDARNKKVSTIVCYRLDRISRNIGDFAKLIEELNALQISFVSIKEQFDTSSPIGRAMMYIASVFSQLERETIAERIRDNMLELAKTGRWLGGNTPTGYSSQPIENVTVDGKVHKAYKLTAIPEEVRLVQQVFNKFLKENSLTKVETYFLQHHITTKRGKAFTRFSIRNILENPVYMIADEDAFAYYEQAEVEIFGGREGFDGKHGIMAYNKTLQKKGKTNQIRDISEWVIAVGKHEGIICGKDWIKAQTLLAQNKSKSYRKPKSNEALLSGLLFCSCGAYMRPKQSQRCNAEGEFIYSYLCETKEKSRCRNCNQKNPNGNAVDKMICEEIKKLSSEECTFRAELEKSRDNLLRHTEDDDAELDRLKGLYAETEKEIYALVSVLSKSPEEVQVYIAHQIKDLHDKKSSLQQRIGEQGGIALSHTLSHEAREGIKGLQSSFAKTFDTMHVAQKRAALRAVIQKITWDGETIRLYLFGASGEQRMGAKHLSHLSSFGAARGV